MRYSYGEFEVIEKTNTIGVRHISELGQFGAFMPISYDDPNNEKEKRIEFLVEKLKDNPMKFKISEGGPYNKCEVSEKEFFEWKNKHLHTN